MAPASQYHAVSGGSWECVGLLWGCWWIFLGLGRCGTFLMMLWPSDLWLSIFTMAPDLLYQADLLNQQWWVLIIAGERHQAGSCWKISCKTLHGLKMITKSVNSWVLLIASLLSSLVDLYFKLFSRAMGALTLKVRMATEPLAPGAGRTAGRHKKGKFGAQTVAMGL